MDKILEEKTYRGVPYILERRGDTFYIERIHSFGAPEVMHAFESLDEAKEIFDKLPGKLIKVIE